MTEQTPHHLKLRNSQPEDYDDIKVIMDLVYDNSIDGAWDKQTYLEQLNRFPEGQICIEDNGKVVAAASSMIVNYKKWGEDHTYDKITSNGRLTHHTYKGDMLYGIDVYVHPDYRGLRLGQRLYDARKELAENLNLKGIVVGGRIPGYHEYKDEMSPQKYVRLVSDQELRDPVLGFQLANDFRVKRILKGYLPEDSASCGYATLLEWVNIYYQKDEQLIGGQRDTARVSLVQWQMRSISSYAEFISQVEFFVDALAGYNADVVLFPEFFNGALMALEESDTPAQAVRYLATYTDRIREDVLQLAVSYNINIIVGSMPEYDDEVLRNASFLCRRDGTWDLQYKIHVTPDEDSVWGLKGGNDIKVFDTDFGKIGILICYDVEFPELSRLQAEHDMQILFVPFLTDTKNGYQRVRRCAQARAIENECYVVTAGSVGNLPRVENMDMQYAQAAVFTPSDFSFPHDAIAAEATPNTEMNLIADLNLENLTELHRQGSVMNLKDRRKDLYDVVWKKKK